ncbi:MAG: sodium/solute symporter [Kordiimonadaceae bacterium]|jgi:solute:Na+ symporter, SSS family|nr:sodium/solute symporter [Kordiimonadaceae bacterium]MDC0081396.1 sodium/sugar symporter [Emcibacteraceae bacterium]MBT6134814.1 sodium/solute symporter [Kordiimonadaceae bacterium]MBT6466283.1 sodium/solute symporter [Kordiimonadaceae bacterium]MBT7543734.1 sodium/solute symporter [Kordiimonadaceae bacterium]
MSLSGIDIAIFIAYVIGLIIVASYVSREKAGHEKNTKDYFLAGNSLTWWAIGASLIAANISAEQIIGMSGSGYAVGLGIASYEWLAAIILMIVGKYFLPIFLKHGIYTMPQYLERRYNRDVKLVLAVFWISVYIFVNLTSVLWLGSLAINTVADVDIVYGLIFLGAFAGAYSLYGGLKAVAFTDIIQVVLLIIGGLYLSYITLNMIGNGAGVVEGFISLTEKAPEKFDMILSKDNPFYKDLPGITALIGAVWVLHFSYWGFNQYIIQRALAAKSIKEAQKGIAFAAILKLIMPIIVVLPGIAAAVLNPGLENPDQAYPQLMTLMPVGMMGLVFAALVAAIVSSLGSMTNSISTIFTMDIYIHYRPNETQRHYVTIGRMVSFISLIIAMICAKPLLGNFDQAFQYVQDFTSFFTPGIVVIFLLGMFWKRTTPTGALAAAIGSFVTSLAFKISWPELPFLDRMNFVFFICLFLAVSASLWVKEESKYVHKLDKADFHTSTGYNLVSVSVFLVLVAIYATWW